MEEIINYNAIRKISTIKLIILSVFTFGIYWYVWLWRLITDINKIYPQKHIHRFGWFAVLIFLEILSVSFYICYLDLPYNSNSVEFFSYIIQLALALQILKNIESYIKQEYNLNIKHNVFGWLFFGCFYINYKINKINTSIQKELSKQIKTIQNASE